MSLPLNELSALPRPIQKSNEHQVVSHSTISEKLSSEENEIKIYSYHKIISDFKDDEEDSLLNFVSLREKEQFGEIDLEFCFMKFDKTPKFFDPMIRKTSFFYVKNRDSIMVPNHKTSFSGVFDDPNYNKGVKTNTRRGTLQSRRASMIPINTKNSKNDRIESLAKIQSDLINRMFKQSEKSYNFTINGKKYQFAENSWFFFDDRNPFRKKVILLYKSSNYKNFILFVCLVNFVAYVTHNYSTRIGQDASTENWASWSLELVCTIIFTFDFLLRALGMGLILGKGTLLKSWFGVWYLIILLASWMIYLPENGITSFCRCIRLLRNNRLIVFIHPLKKNLDSFLNSLPNFMKTYMSLISLMIFYSILGLHLLKGFDENRCRFNEFPVNKMWPADESIRNLCGEWECPSERFCMNPSDYGFEHMEEENKFRELNYGLTNFDTIFNSFFTVLHFIDTIGWTSITYNYWKTMNQLAAALYFTSMVIFGAFIFMNILLATLYESFVSKESIKHSLEKKIKKQEKTKKKDQVSIADLTIAKTLRSSPTVKNVKSIRLSMDEDPYRDKVLRKMSTQRKLQVSNKFRDFLFDILESSNFRRVISFFLIIDFISLSMDRFPISSFELTIIYHLDFAVFWIFFMEILLRILIYGPKLFFQSMFNIYDFIIMIANLIEYIYEATVFPNHIYGLETQTGPIFRIMKLLRIYRLLYYSNFFKKISLLTKALFKTLDKIKYFMLFVVFLTVTCALIGQELFAYRVHVKEDGSLKTPRINFDNFYHSIITVVMAFYNEDWNVVMYETYESVGSTAIIYYMLLIIVGQMTFIVLLKALILNYFIKSTSRQFFDKDNSLKALTFIKSKLNSVKNGLKSPTKSPTLKPTYIKPNNLPRKSEVIKPLKRQSWKENTVVFKRSYTSNVNVNKNKKSFDFNLFKEKKNSAVGPEFSSKNLTSLVIPANFELNEARNNKNNSNNTDNNNNNYRSPSSISPPPRSPSPSKKKPTLPLFDSNKKYQLFIYKILISNHYHYFMFLVTVISMVLQILDSNFDQPDSQKQEIIKFFDRALGLIYFIEFILNVITYGLICGENSYLQQSFYNKLDFCNIIITLCDMFTNKYQNRVFRTLKIVRTFRLLKVATTTTQEIQIISKAFIDSFPNLMVLIVFFLIFLSISALIATRYMKGSLFHCMISNFEEFEAKIHDKLDCFDNGGDWLDEDISYNNVLSSLMSLFQISSCQGWTILMEKFIDGVGVDVQPKEDYNTAKAVFFLVFFFISNFILLNMFIGIITENIIVNKNKQRGLDKLTEEQREWAIIKANILKLKPKPLKCNADKPLKRVLYLLLNHKYVSIFFDTCIVLNLIVLMAYHHRQSPETLNLLNSLNYFFISVFTIENFMKLALHRKNYFHSKKCLYEGFILLVIWIDVLIQAGTYIPESHIQNPYIIFIAIVKGLQATRIYRIFKRIQSVKQIYDTLFHVMPTFLNMLLLIMLILYMYAIVGMQFFAYIRPQAVINDDLHFRSFPITFFTLVRVASSETWFLVFSDAVRQQQPNFVCETINTYYDYEKYGLKGCGSYWAYPYFLSFHILFSLVILNLFVAIVLTQYDDEFKAHQSAINKYQLKGIKNEWRLSDPNGDGYINYKDFWRFASKIAGLLDIQQTVESKKKFLKLLRIPVYENAKTKIFSYKFHDVIIELSKMSVLVKYGVINLDTEEEEGSEVMETEERSETSKKKQPFNKTQFFCGDMSSIILISKLIRTWAKKARKEYDADNAANDIFDLTKIALKRRRTEKIEAQKLSQKLEEDEDDDKNKIEESNKNDIINNNQSNNIEPNSPEMTFQDDIIKRPPNIIKYNIMNEMTLDEGSTILSGNRSIDASNSNRPLIEEGGPRRRASILKNQYAFGESSPKKKAPGKKIKFTLDQ